MSIGFITIFGEKVKGRDKFGLPFCHKEKLSIVLENELVMAFYDKYPVKKGHLLIIPKQHVHTYFDSQRQRSP